MDLKTYTDKSIRKDFDENEVGANLKYSKPFAVKGVIKEFRSGVGNIPSIIFNVGGAFDMVVARFEPGQVLYIADMKKGKSVELWCSAASDYGSAAILRGCLTPKEIDNLKEASFDDNFKKLISGEEFNLEFTSSILYPVLESERIFPFSLCPKNRGECTFDDIDGRSEKKYKDLYEEVQVINYYYLGKLVFLVKNMYGDEDALRLTSGERRIVDDPGILFKDFYEKGKEKNKDSKIFKIIENNYQEMINFKY